MGIELEVGKEYRDAMGRRVHIFAKHPTADMYLGDVEDLHPIMVTVLAYHSDGRGFWSAIEIPDLVKEYEELAKYSVEVWVKNKPKPSDDLILTGRLLGPGNVWNGSKTECCTRKVRVTVEEVE